MSATLLALALRAGDRTAARPRRRRGSALAVPVRVYVLDQPVKDATTESLLVVGTAALVGAVDHARVGRVQLRTALAFGAAGALGALAGAALNRLTGAQALLLTFALLLLGSATLHSRAWERSASARVA